MTREVTFRLGELNTAKRTKTKAHWPLGSNGSSIDEEPQKGKRK
jgi:hypothetical protein